MARLSKTNRNLLEKTLSELNHELALARKYHDKEEIIILEAQINSVIRELNRK